MNLFSMQLAERNYVAFNKLKKDQFWCYKVSCENLVLT